MGLTFEFSLELFTTHFHIFSHTELLLLLLLLLLLFCLVSLGLTQSIRKVINA